MDSRRRLMHQKARPAGVVKNIQKHSHHLRNYTEVDCNGPPTNPILWQSGALTINSD